MVLHSRVDRRNGDGRGKTLVATACPAYLNALEGRGVHVVTGQRLTWRLADMEGWGLYLGLGLSVRRHSEQHGGAGSDNGPTTPDITYGTNNEFGFDYLRDNMPGGARRRAVSKASYSNRRRHCISRSSMKWITF